MADQKPKVTLGYARSKGLYHIDQIEGNKPMVTYTSERTVRVGDWLDETDAENLGLTADLIVRPYRLDA